MNKFNTMPEEQNSSVPTQEKINMSQDLAQALSDQGEVKNENDENSLDLAYLQKTHPVFVKYEFSDADMEYLESVKDQLVKDPSLSSLQKVISELSEDRTDLTEVITVILFGKALEASTKR